MNIGIDLKPFFSGSKYRGIGMYSRELIFEMLKKRENIKYHFLNLYEDYIGDPVMNETSFLDRRQGLRLFFVSNRIANVRFTDTNQRHDVAGKRFVKLFAVQSAVAKNSLNSC